MCERREKPEVSENLRNASVSQLTHFRTCDTVFGPNHSPTRLSSESPINAIVCIEYGFFRSSSKRFTIFKYVGSLLCAHAQRVLDVRFASNASPSSCHQNRISPAFRRPVPITAQMQIEQSLCQNHLTASQHTAPALVRRITGLTDRCESTTICAPQTRLYIASYLIEF